MRIATSSRVTRPALAGGTVVLMAALLTACVTTASPQRFRTFLVPPARAVTVPDQALLEPPHLAQNRYANEAPFLIAYVPDVPRPSDTDLLLKRADDAFNAGKRAYQDGRTDDARGQFNLALETLLTAPENLPDRNRLERRLDELADEIYRFDADQASQGEPDDRVSYDKSPLDDVLEMTFPVDPGLRGKVREQIRATASQLPLEENDAVIGAIHFFSTERGGRILAAGLRRAGRYKAMIERTLAEEGLPPELIFVAQAESGFLPRARSNKQCVGLWQFAKFRGQEYGLGQTAATDDRMDPEKATRAAARHLHDLYTHFGDWYLALAAYDCGPNCVDHAVMRTGFADYWTLRRLNVLPKETVNYVPVIIAMTIMSKNAKDYDLAHLDADSPVDFDTIELQTPTHLALAADALAVPLNDLRDLNPALLRSIAPAGYGLHVPKGSVEAVESAFALVPLNRRDSWRVHRVESGDTFASLAKRYGTAVASLSSANHGDLPAAGQLMAVPVAYPGDRTARPAAKGRPARKRIASAAHRVPARTHGRRTAATRSPAS